jgi:hypothetical protein
VVHLPAGDGRERVESIFDYNQCGASRVQHQRRPGCASSKGEWCGGVVDSGRSALFERRFPSYWAFQSRRYSPGMITGVVLYIPIAIYGFVHFLRSGQASPPTALAAALIGGSYHFISFANHRRRTRAARAKA